MTQDKSNCHIHVVCSFLPLEYLISKLPHLIGSMAIKFKIVKGASSVVNVHVRMNQFSVFLAHIFYRVLQSAALVGFLLVLHCLPF